ncbi:hypothetical protein V9T40_012246 [Parthenolecanium corni]|uniref:cAMP-dependent protein kinase n=1 Tax=Parthenolecanium corni TaxID=536013 RepID=A0AAN9T7G5_9HEMI
MTRWFQNLSSTFQQLSEPSPSQNPLLPILTKAKERVERKWAADAKNTAALSDFELVRTLGSGTFGRVMLVRYMSAEIKPYYAMKIMTKRKIMRANHLRHAVNERKILSSIKYPFVVNYLHHFKDNGHVFLVMEYVAGGDMFTHLRKLRKFDEELARFYAAQVVLAFEYLHFVGIVYRDLKPENVMIDKTGFLKITDFGFAKKIDDKRTDTMCGTPEYYAPEMVKNHSYTYSVDWWTLGVLIFEMTDGRPPFRSSNVLKLFQLILENSIAFPDFFSSSLKSIIQNLTKSERTKRLNSAATIKAHKFFEKVDWMALYKRSMTPPYTPNVYSESDTHNFEKQTEEKLENYPDELYAEEFTDF